MGGYALADANVKGIERKDISKTIEYVSRLTSIPVSDLHPLGSVGKLQISGDIDLAVDITIYDPKRIHETLLNVIGPDCGKYNAGTNIGSYAIPIAGAADNGLVQVDLMYVANVEWAKFFYFSPGDKSQFKGAIRNILLSAIASTHKEPNMDAFVYDDNGDWLVRVGWGISPQIGLKRMFQLRSKSEITGKWLKAMKNVEPQEIMYAYPDLAFNGLHFIFDNPQDVVTFLFREHDVRPTDVETSEQVIVLIQRVFSPERTEQIFNVAKKRAAPLAKKMDIPKEIQ